MAQRGKTSVGWFFGFKLRLVVNDRGELLACRLTRGNADDRTPVPHRVNWAAVEPSGFGSREGLIMGARDIDRSLEQWQMGIRDLRRRLILAPTPRERERWHALRLLAQSLPPAPAGGWTAPARRRPWEGTPTPSGVGRRPSDRAALRP